MTSHTPIMHGLKLSYFTGKLEAYFRAKGLPYEFRELDMATFRRAGRATGYLQMPQLEFPDGSWLTDTTAIIAHYENEVALPALHPSAQLGRFYSLLLEDVFDEWLWRPGLYYRWAFKEDTDLMGSQIARTMLRDMPAPAFIRRQFIRHRQRRVYLRDDGITKATAPAVEQLFLDVLDRLEAIFSVRPYLFGERPVEADFGLFGPFFRHFSHDPTPHGILRDRAPHTLRWIAELWAATPDRLTATTQPDAMPPDLQPLIDRLVPDYLSYLKANAMAFTNGQKTTGFQADGLAWSVPTAPYRVHCLNAQKRGYLSLESADQKRVDQRLGAAATILSEPETPLSDHGPITDRMGVQTKGG